MMMSRSTGTRAVGYKTESKMHTLLSPRRPTETVHARLAKLAAPRKQDAAPETKPLGPLVSRDVNEQAGLPKAGITLRR